MKDKQNLERKKENILAQIKVLDIKLKRLQITKENLEKQAALVEEQLGLED